jgi:ubiquinone/menaquinone biosynthesis C-methylase UbiE
MKNGGLISNLVSGFDDYRARRIADNLTRTIQTKGRVLDCGCGKMAVAKLVSQELGTRVVGVDVISLNNTDLNMCIGDAGRLPFADNSFEAVYAVSVLHHTLQAQTVLKECLRVTRNQLVIVEDVYQNEFELELLKVFDWIGNRPVSAEMHLPFTFRSESQWRRLFKKLGAKVRSVKSIRPVPWRPTRHRMFVLTAD